MNFDTVIIDDDEVTLILIKKVMEASNFHDSPIFFSNASQGVDHLRNKLAKNKPSVIFLDINMPRISGWEILDELEQLHQKNRIHVILVSSSINKADKIKASTYQSTITYMEKPIVKKDFEDLKNHQELAYLFRE